MLVGLAREDPFDDSDGPSFSEHSRTEKPQTVSPPLIRRLGMSPRWQSATLTTRLVIVVSLVRGEPKHHTFLPWTGPVAFLSPARYDRPLLSSGGGEGPALLDSLLWRRAPLRPLSSSALSVFFLVRVSSKGEIVPNFLFWCVSFALGFSSSSLWQ